MASKLLLTRYDSKLEPDISCTGANDKEVHGVDLDGPWELGLKGL